MCADVCVCEMCADVLIVVIPSRVFGIEVSCYYCIGDVAKLVEVGYVVLGTVGEVSGGIYVLIMFMCCVCQVLILTDCVSTVVSGLMRFCVTSVVSVYLIV